MTEVDVLEVVARDRLAFEEDGLAFDPGAGTPKPPGPGEGGRGLLLVRSFAKRLEHSRPAGRNRTEVLLPE